MAEDPKAANSETFKKLQRPFINLFKVTLRQKISARRAAEAKREGCKEAQEEAKAARMQRGETVDDRSNSEAIQDGLKGR